jgi:hypothetical protein
MIQLTVYYLLNKNIGASSIYTSSLDDPTLTNYRLKTPTNNFITFVDSNDTIVNLNSGQTLSNKTLNNNKFSNNQIKTILNNTVIIPEINDTLVGKTNSETLSNKTLQSPIINNANLNYAALDTNSTAITQLSSDNSTKIATTAFVKLFSGYQKWSNPTPNTGILSINFDTYTFTMQASGGNLYIKSSGTLNKLKIRYQTAQYGTFDNSAGIMTLTTSDQTITETAGGTIGSIGKTILGTFINDDGETYRFQVVNFSGASSSFLYQFFIERLV